jgi:predicted alpha/beta hydrolase
VNDLPFSTTEAGIKETRLRIQALDDYPLAATLFSPDAGAERVVVINSAAAVPRKIYYPFARYLARRGFAVMTYDYRGVGESRPDKLRHLDARMRDWAECDAAGALECARTQFPNFSIGVVGHSFGGHALGLAHNNQLVVSAVIIASHAGYWRYCVGFEKYRIYALFNLVLPPMSLAFGYAPLKRFGFGEDLPKGVGGEWSRWCGMKRYFFDDPSLASLGNFAQMRAPLLAIGVDDDLWATPQAIDLLVSGFSGSKVVREQIAPARAGLAKMGHFGWFRPSAGPGVWGRAAEWLGRSRS